MREHYRIAGPAVISFSGGRTSAYMLHEILSAHDGKLPSDVLVAFANTGKEREETLRFVQECGSRWNVPIAWLEWRNTEEGYERIGFNSASRNGEPFEALIAKKQFLPNAVTRFCTTELKVRTIKKFAQDAGFKRWDSVIGLRYDEGHRVLKALARNESNKETFKAVMPMAKAKATKRGHVMPFWLGDPLPQGFDLGLKDYEGNCDLCFLKARATRARLMRDNPGMGDWWKHVEATVTPRLASGARFVTEYSYEDLEREVANSPLLPIFEDEEYDVECGLLCEAA